MPVARHQGDDDALRPDGSEVCDARGDHIWTSSQERGLGVLDRHSVDAVDVGQQVQQSIAVGHRRVTVDRHHHARRDRRWCAAAASGKPPDLGDRCRGVCRRDGEEHPPVGVLGRSPQRCVRHAADEDRRHRDARASTSTVRGPRAPPAFPAIRSGSTAQGGVGAATPLATGHTGRRPRPLVAIAADADAEQQPVAGHVLQRRDLLGDPHHRAQRERSARRRRAGSRSVAPAAAARATMLSTTGTPVPATSWSTTQTDSKPSASAWRAAATTSPGTASRVLMRRQEDADRRVRSCRVLLQWVGYPCN